MTRAALAAEPVLEHFYGVTRAACFDQAEQRQSADVAKANCPVLRAHSAPVVPPAVKACSRTSSCSKRRAARS
jgi:hypothetical protein